MLLKAFDDNFSGLSSVTDEAVVKLFFFFGHLLYLTPFRIFKLSLFFVSFYFVSPLSSRIFCWRISLLLGSPPSLPIYTSCSVFIVFLCSNSVCCYCVRESVCGRQMRLDKRTATGLVIKISTTTTLFLDYQQQQQYVDIVNSFICLFPVFFNLSFSFSGLLLNLVSLNPFFPPPLCSLTSAVENVIATSPTSHKIVV